MLIFRLNAANSSMRKVSARNMTMALFIQDTDLIFSAPTLLPTATRQSSAVGKALSSMAENEI